MVDARNNGTAAPARPAPTRTELLARWMAARRRPEAAQRGSEEVRQAVIEVGELEVAMNALDVASSEAHPTESADAGERTHS